MREKRWIKKPKSMADFFQEDFVKEAAEKGNNISINVKPPSEKKGPAIPPSEAQQAAPPPADMGQPPAGGPPMGMEQAPGNQPMGVAGGGDMAAQQGAAPGQPMTSDQVDPMTGMPLNGQQPGMMPTPTNDVRQSGLPATGIVCNSDCRFAQNLKGMCSLNKIDFTQVKQGVFECENYEPIGSEPYVGE